MTSRTGNALVRAAQRRKLRLARNPHEIFFGGNEHQAIGLRARDQFLRLRRRVAVVVGKACALGDLNAGRSQGGKKFLGIADAGECKNFAAADRRDDAAIGLEASVEDGHAAPLRAIEDESRAIRRTDDDQRLCAVELQVERRPHRPRRDDVAVADAAAAIDDDYGQILGKRRVLQPVIHYDDAGAGELREFCAGDTVARDDGGRKPGEEERLVADVTGPMDRRIDAHGPGKLAAIAAA